MNETLNLTAEPPEAEKPAELVAQQPQTTPTPIAAVKRKRTKKPPMALQRTTQAMVAETAKARRLPNHTNQWVDMARRAWRWLQEKRQRQSASRRLRLCETVSLGEKRFLAIVKVDGEQFLIGGAAGNVSLLTKLARADSFTTVLRQRQGNRRASA